MYIRWKKRGRSGRVRLYEAGGDLLVAYATESKRVDGQPRQTTTYLGSIREGYGIGQIDRCLAENLDGVRKEKRAEVTERVTFLHVTRRLLFWSAVEHALDEIACDRGALKATLAETVAPITKAEADMVFRECISWPDGYPAMLRKIGHKPPWEKKKA